MPELADGEPVPALRPRAPGRPKDGTPVYGDRARMILGFLRQHEGRPVSTMEIVGYIVKATALQFPSMAEHDEFRRRVRYRLCGYVKKGVFEQMATSQGGCRSYLASEGCAHKSR